MTTTEIERLKRYFDLKNLHISNYWLECCLSWFKEQHNTYNEETMCSEILQQWLDADLRDIEVRSLPNNLSKEKKTILNGNYAVQVLYVKDISKSSLSQLKSIRDMYKLTRSVTDNENESSSTGKRVLYLNMTDGVQILNGFEYQLVSCLSINMKPGIKILLTGPLLVRNGEFLLKENNVKILGGEVEDLLICNAVENVLARELNMPENPNPGKFETKTEINNTNNAVTTRNNLINMPNVTQNNIQTINRNFNNTNIINVQRNVDHFHQNNDNQRMDLNMDDDDELFANINVSEQFEEIQPERNIDQDDFKDMDFDIEVLEEIERDNNRNTKSNEHKPVIKMQDSYDFCLEDELELMERIENEFKEREPKCEQVTDSCDIPIVDIIKPFVYIKYLQENSDKIQNKSFKVKAQFMRAVEKLSISKSKEWTMKFEIMDSTGKITVDFSSSIIEKLMDLSPIEALAENKKVKSKVTETHEKLSEALVKCKEKLEMKQYIMDLHFKEGSEIPRIVGLETIEKQHLEQLKNRVECAQNAQVQLF